MRPLTIAMAALLLTAIVVPAVLAQASAQFDLGWHVIAGGGGRSASSGFVVQGSIGQPAAGRLSSTDYVLSSGFWYSISPVTELHNLYLPVVLKTFS